MDTSPPSNLMHDIPGLEDEKFVYIPNPNNSCLKNPTLSRFESFMSITNEKSLLANFIGNQIQNQFQIQDRKIIISDIGSGTGELITKSIACSEIPSSKVHLNAIEPATNLLKEVPINIVANNLNEIEFRGYPTPFEDFIPNEKSDIILASHLYHLKGKEYLPYLRKMAGMLSESGKMIFVYRSQEMDDLRRLRIDFTPKILNQTYNPRDISSVSPFIKEVVEENGMKGKIHTITSDVNFNECEDQIKNSALEFILNIDFNNYPEESVSTWMNQIGHFLKESNNILTNKQDVVVISH